MLKHQPLDDKYAIKHQIGGREIQGLTYWALGEFDIIH